MQRCKPRNNQTLVKLTRPLQKRPCQSIFDVSAANFSFHGSVGSQQADRRRANMAHMTPSRPDSSLGFQVTVLKPCEVVPSSLGSGRRKARLGTLGPW